MLRTLIVATPFVLGGAYFAGLFGGGYSRDIDRSPVEVERALASYDIRSQPGAPGSTAEAAGGVQPLISLDEKPEQMTWTVMSGDKVAVRMIAMLTPLDGGKRTRVTTRIERGDAPDEYISPAFRSTGLTAGLFATGLDAQIDKYLLSKGDPEKCREIVERFREDGERAQEDRDPGLEQPSGLKQAIGRTAASIITISALEGQLRSAGCDVSGKAPFEPVRSEMGPADAASSTASADYGAKAIKPMVDLSHH